jgi:hypothetical protein
MIEALPKQMDIDQTDLLYMNNALLWSLAYYVLTENVADVYIYDVNIMKFVWMFLLFLNLNWKYKY